MTIRLDRLAEAAAARSSLYRAQKDRPAQRRAGEHPGCLTSAVMPAQMRFDSAPAEIGSDPLANPGLDFIGIASSTNSGYPMWDAAGEYTEIVAPGAFRSSLALGPALDVPLVLDHTSIRRVARTTIPAGQLGHLELSETELGLLCRAVLDPTDPDVAYIAPKIASGLITEMSFRFSIDAGEWSKDFTTFTITDAGLQRGDVSIVGFGANPNTPLALSRAASPQPAQAVRSFLVRDSDLR